MQVSRNPFALFSRDGAVGACAVTGRLKEFNASERERLHRLANGAATISAVDIPLIDAGFVIPATADKSLREEVRRTIQASIRQSGQLVVMPTERCNFRCTYCYETFERGRISDELVRALIKYLERSVPEYQVYHLAWFGGEPLIHRDLVADVTRDFRRLQTNAGTTGTVSVTTNGWYLTAEVAEDLEDAGVDIYQITLDGPEDVHNTKRLLSTGAPTYGRIVENVQGVLFSTRAKVMIRINVDTTDTSAVAVVGKWLQEDLFPRFGEHRDRVEFNVVPIWTADTYHIEGICLTDIQRYQVWKSVLEQSLEWSDMTLPQYLATLATEVGKLACYAGKPGNYVLGSDGTVYKCTVAFDKPENRIGNLGLDGRLNLDHGKELLWTSANALTDPVCGSCAMSLSCQGLFCPLLRMQTDAQPCPTERRFYGDLLETSKKVKLALA